MTIAFARNYALVPRGGPGLACDEDGVALGPIPLVDAATDASGRRCYRMRPAGEVAQALRLAYGMDAEEIERCRRGFARVAELLTAGERAQAGIRAVLLRLAEIAPDSMAKLAWAAELQKYNPNWADEPRNPAGTPEGGEWTSDGEEQRPTEDAYFQPAAAHTNDIQAMKERFVDAHLADTQKAADELGIPVENILGLAAVEAGWGTSRIAIRGNNFFGIHYPARHAIGYVPPLPGGTKYAAFASYADCLKSFVAISRSLIQGKSDPQVFAAALQNSGKFGIYDSGARVPTYIRDVVKPFRDFVR